MKIKLTYLVLMVFLLAACGDTIRGREVAEPKVVKFHEQLKARDFEGMYDSTSPEFKAAESKDRIVALFEAIDRKLGALQETQQVNWSVNTQNLTTTVVLVYQSTFSGGEATEAFTFRVKDADAQLIGYNISSFDMLIK